jgi:hypothetical protein
VRQLESKREIKKGKERGREGKEKGRKGKGKGKERGRGREKQ